MQTFAETLPKQSANHCSYDIYSHVRIVCVFKVPGWREGGGLRERSEVMTRKCMFTANTWRTLCKISEPQGCHYTVFLTSATFPSHPKTHDCNANKDGGPVLRPETQSQIERHRNVLKTSSFLFFFYLLLFFFFPGDVLHSIRSPAAVQDSQTSGLTSLYKKA